jgi:hypothetical protein
LLKNSIAWKISSVLTLCKEETCRRIAGHRHVIVSRKTLAAGIAALTGGRRLAAHESRIRSKLRHFEVKLALSK